MSRMRFPVAFHYDALGSSTFVLNSVCHVLRKTNDVLDCHSPMACSLCKSLHLVVSSLTETKHENKEQSSSVPTLSDVIT